MCLLAATDILHPVRRYKRRVGITSRVPMEVADRMCTTVAKGWLTQLRRMGGCNGGHTHRFRRVVNGRHDLHLQTNTENKRWVVFSASSRTVLDNCKETKGRSSHLLDLSSQQACSNWREMDNIVESTGRYAAVINNNYNDISIHLFVFISFVTNIRLGSPGGPHDSVRCSMSRQKTRRVTSSVREYVVPRDPIDVILALCPRPAPGKCCNIRGCMPVSWQKP